MEKNPIEKAVAKETEDIPEVANDKVHDAIKDFVSALAGMYGKSDKPLALYNRLLSKMLPEDSVSIERNVGAFRGFLRSKGKFIKDAEAFSKIPEDSKIKYSERIFIDIGRFVKRSDEDTRKSIREHLLTIMAILNPGDATCLDELASFNIDTSTKEGSFLNEIMGEFKDTMESSDNAGAAIASIMGSGLIPKMFKGLENGLRSGEMNVGGLFQTIQSTMGSLIGPEAANILNPKMLQNLVSSVAEPTENGGEKEDE